MKTELKEIEVNGVEYIRKDSVISGEKAKTLDGLEYVIIRTYSAGVFAGYLKKRDGKEAELLKARRLWYWSGSASLSQLSMEGTKDPDNCKFPCEVDSIILTETIEVLSCTQQAQTSIQGVKIWEQ